MNFPQLFKRARPVSTADQTPAPSEWDYSSSNLGKVQPLITAEPDLSLEKRIAGLENKAFYDGQYIAQLRAELTAAGACIDALTARVNKLSGAGLSSPSADNPPVA